MDDLHRALARKITILRINHKRSRSEYLRIRSEEKDQKSRIAGALGWPGINREAKWDELFVLILEQRAAMNRLKLNEERRNAL